MNLVRTYKGFIVFVGPQVALGGNVDSTNGALILAHDQTFLHTITTESMATLWDDMDILHWIEANGAVDELRQRFKLFQGLRHEVI